MSPPRFDVLSDAVARIARRVPATVLRPEGFFVARYGVLTLAYKGFPEPLLQLKKALAQEIEGIPPENPGSRWPKTTLAALRDDGDMEPDDIVLLREATQEGTVCLSRRRPAIAVDFVELVELRCRSMESTGRSRVVRLEGGRGHERVPTDHRAEVVRVLDQWRRSGLSRYVPDLRRPGHRESHYRGPIREWSLVVRARFEPDCLTPFRRAVEARLPGRYAWFESESLHVTVRGLGIAADD